MADYALPPRENTSEKADMLHYDINLWLRGTPSPRNTHPPTGVGRWEGPEGMFCFAPKKKIYRMLKVLYNIGNFVIIGYHFWIRTVKNFETKQIYTKQEENTL